MAHEKIGTYECWSCNERIPVKKTATGKLSAPCPWCDFPHYANEGTKHYSTLMAATTLDAAPAPRAAAAPPGAPAAAPDPVPIPAPAVKARRSPVAFGGR